MKQKMRKEGEISGYKKEELRSTDSSKSIQPVLYQRFLNFLTKSK